MNYQKTYMNHIHSSSLLCQLATMWKSQTLCDAIIRSGNNITRAHRVVLVAACPMLQSMENAASGSHLEVRVASDIKVESIHTFLQYLYEGFMTLTEENCRDVEKIARLLQVEGVVKCCADFHKCLNTSSAGQYKYSLLDQIEFRHVRTTELSKCQDRIQKRQSESGRISPVGKRQKVNRPSSPPSDHSMSQRMSDMHSMSESYMPDANDPWDRVPRIGASSGRSGGQPGVIDIVEDSLELIQTDPPGKHQGENNFDTRRVQQTVGISVASQHNKGADLQIVNVAEQAMSSAPRPQSDIIPSSPSSSSSSSFKDTANSSRPPDPRSAAGPPPPQLQRMDPGRQPQHGTINLVDIPHSPEPETSKQVNRQQGRSSDVFPPSSMPSAPQRGGDNFQSTSTPQRQPQPFPVSLTAVSRGGQPFQSKPYAAGSAVQAEALSPRGPRSQGRGDADRASPAERAKDSGSKSTPDIPDSAPDISIVKVEHSSSNLAGDTTGGLDMFVSDGGVSLAPVQGQGHGEDDEHSDFELEEPPGEMSKEGDMSNEGGDQSANWYMGNMKAPVEKGGVTSDISSIRALQQVSPEQAMSISALFQGSVIDLDGNSRQSGESVRHYCDFCMREFPTRGDYELHVQVTAHDGNFRCRYCFKMFTNKQERSDHIKTHLGDFVKICESCGKGFKSTGGYQTHCKMYHGSGSDGLYKCEICGKMFPTPSRLSIHERAHSQEKGFYCIVCNKSFKHKYYLQKHICRPMNEGDNSKEASF